MGSFSVPLGAVLFLQLILPKTVFLLCVNVLLHEVESKMITKTTCMIQEQKHT